MPMRHAQIGTEHHGDQQSTMKNKFNRSVQASIAAPNSFSVRPSPTNLDPRASHTPNMDCRAVSTGSDLPARTPCLDGSASLFVHGLHSNGQNMSNDVRAHKDINDRVHGRVAELSPRVHEIRQTQLPPGPVPVVQKGAPPASDPRNDQAVFSTEMSLTNTTMLASPRGMTSTGHRDGYRNKGRRDYQGQRNFNNGFYPQHKQFSSGADIVEPGQTRQWRREGISNYNNRHQNSPHCINSRADPYDYNDCSCRGCAERNKSIWIRVKDTDVTDTKDIQARLKFGLGARFGDVDEVFPVQHRMGNAFIVR